MADRRLSDIELGRSAGEAQMSRGGVESTQSVEGRQHRGRTRYMILPHAILTNYPLSSGARSPILTTEYSLEWQILPVEPMTNRQVVGGGLSRRDLVLFAECRWRSGGLTAGRSG